ncbi:MAG: ABC transporter permease, partial [Lachnospiraceae bacterium]|nr:ABC transporter permease [Lachnospiraceae bacterium]
MKTKITFLKDQRILLSLVIVAIVAIVAMINPRFIAVKNLITIFQQISVIGILTMAMSMLLISGGIDLSIGNIMVLSGVVMAQIISVNGNV